MRRFIAWLKVIWFCHHNARVIADFENRMTQVTLAATGGRLRDPYHELEDVMTEIDAAHEREYENGREDGLAESAADKKENENGR